jgi:hypothetical protein
MPNPLPYEVIAAAPIRIYLATASTARPGLQENPSGAWTLLGSSGDLNYDDGSGVSIEHPQTLVPWRSLGESGARKIFRQDEDCRVKVKVVDLTLEQYAHALNENSITTTPAAMGVAGSKKIGLSRGLFVATKAILIRLLVSPYGEDWIGQYWFPRAVSAGSPTVQFMKTVPAGLELQYDSLVDPTQAESERFGILEWQTDDPDT